MVAGIVSNLAVRANWPPHLPHPPQCLRRANLLVAASANDRRRTRHCKVPVKSRLWRVWRVWRAQRATLCRGFSPPGEGENFVINNSPAEHDRR